MTVKETIQDKKVYQRWKLYGLGILSKFCKTLNNAEKEDIVSEAFEKILESNNEIQNHDSFLKGYFSKTIKYLALNYLNGKYKKKVEFPKALDSNTEDIDYKEIDTNILNKIKEKDEKLYNLLVNPNLKVKEKAKLYGKYNMRELYRKAKMIIEDKEIYTGVARIKDGKIIKCYPKASFVKKDGFTPTTVVRLCRGNNIGKRGNKLLHRGYEFKYLKDIENEQEK